MATRGTRPVPPAAHATSSSRRLTTRSSEQRLAGAVLLEFHVLRRQPLSLSLEALGHQNPHHTTFFMPEWHIPDNLQQLIDADPDLTWEDNQWEPLLLTVMAGTSYGGRDIPLAWQLEFQPGDDAFAAANQKIVALGAKPDGYGWGGVIQSVFARHHPELVAELHFGDCEADTCVVWTESESTCQLLVQATWSLTHPQA